jgi:UDP-N-acetylmuramate--alanine ligase
LKPTYVIGGVLQNTGSNAGLGNDDYFVVEADESDSSLLLMNPNVLIITNVEADHMDHFENYEQIQSLFEQCIAKLPKDGLLIVCADDPGVRQLLKSAQSKNILPSRVITYGFEEGLDYRADNVRFEKNHIRFSMIRSAQKTMVEMELAIPGKHNVLNSLAVAALAQIFRIPQSALKTALRDFRDARRRFMQLGEWQDILVIDDYAHHPTEIQSVLEAIRSGWPDRKLVAVFQPHRFTRTHYFQKEFAQALSLADEVILTDVYAASEKPMEGISGQTILKWLGDVSHQYFKRKEEVSLYLSEVVVPKSVVVVMGAGDINHVAKDYWNRLQQKDFKSVSSLAKSKIA